MPAKKKSAAKKPAAKKKAPRKPAAKSIPKDDFKELVAAAEIFAYDENRSVGQFSEAKLVLRSFLEKHA